MKSAFKYVNNINSFSTKHWRKILVAGVTSATFIAGSSYYQNRVSKPFSLYSALEYYGFSSQQQKDALEDLLKQASIISPNETLQSRFSRRHSYNDAVKDIIEFVKLSQSHFTIRTGFQERWEIKPLEWMEQDREKKSKALEILGFINELKPSIQVTDAICILGATMKSMQGRLGYADLLLQRNLQAKSMILLAGERYVTIGVDGSKEELSKAAHNQNIFDISKLTETHLIKEAYKNSAVNNKLPTYVIDTPARGLPRPTTQTTILELISWLKEHNDIRSIVFISNQPNVKYQEAIIRETFRSKNIQIYFDVVGNEVKDKNKVQPFLEAFGTYIWAQTPAVLLKIGRTIDDPDIIKSLKELYEKQPLIYHNLEGLLIPNEKGKSRN